MQIIKDIRHIFEWVRDEINSITRYHLKYLKRGLVNCTEKHMAIGNDAIQRIICSNKLTKNDLITRSEAYLVTGDWEIIVRKPHSQKNFVIDNKTPKVKQIFANFVRSPPQNLMVQVLKKKEMNSK